MSSKTPNAFKFLLKIYAKHPSDFDERANNKRNKQTKEELRIALQFSTEYIGYTIIRRALTTWASFLLVFKASLLHFEHLLITSIVVLMRSKIETFY